MVQLWSYLVYGKLRHAYNSHKHILRTLCWGLSWWTQVTCLNHKEGNKSLQTGPSKAQGPPTSGVPFYFMTGHCFKEMPRYYTFMISLSTGCRQQHQNHVHAQENNSSHAPMWWVSRYVIQDLCESTSKLVLFLPTFTALALSSAWSMLFLQLWQWQPSRQNSPFAKQSQ